MQFANGFNTLTALTELSVVISAALAFALMTVLLFIRARNRRVRTRQESVTAAWREIFGTAYGGDPEPNPLPKVENTDWFTVLQLFAQFHDIREHDRSRAHKVLPRLDSLAQRVGIPRHALGLLQRGDSPEKVLALNVLGHLRDRRAYALAVQLSEDRGSEMSRAAAHCALRIDPRFLDRVLELVQRRDDWVRSRIEGMLKDVGAKALTAAMSTAIAKADSTGKPRLLDYLRFCTPAGARAICRDVLASAAHHETLAAALRSLAPLAGEEDRATALHYCRHREPVVILSALRVLRRCVQYEDRDVLSVLLTSPNYWVRLRAAEVVVELYGDTGLAQQMMEHHQDRFARDAIRQAIAERRLMAGRKARPERRGTQAPESIASQTASA